MKNACCHQNCNQGDDCPVRQRQKQDARDAWILKYEPAINAAIVAVFGSFAVVGLGHIIVTLWG